jgi:hypothetical protein
MSSNISTGASAGVKRILGGAAEPVKRPNVVAVGTWLARARAMREATVYVPRHRAAGPAV